VSERTIHWFQRDLRVSDNPALVEAVAVGTNGVLPLFVLDPETWRGTATVQQAYLLRSLSALDASLDGNLTVKVGDPRAVVPALANEISAQSVHLAASYTPGAAHRQTEVIEALASKGVQTSVVGSSYAVAPGRVRKGDGSAYRVFTPFHRAWLAHGWRAPIGAPRDATWMSVTSDDVGPEPAVDVDLPGAGEACAQERWSTFVEKALDDYAHARDRADVDGTSRMSVHLRFGELHPRSLLADIGGTDSHDVFRKELAWREFYADVLFHNPESADDYLRREFAGMQYDKDEVAHEHLKAWQEGRTGYPLVDAAMRQLLHSGWMHNRARMVVASFLVKDLHLEWQQGADWFMRHLVDGDVASNSHGWQWTAGSGTDAAPYIRIFNPVSQGLKCDPLGDYVRNFVPELRHLSGTSAHEPWKCTDGYAHGYPHRIVDHAAERQVALQRYQSIRSSG